MRISEHILIKDHDQEIIDALFARRCNRYAQLAAMDMPWTLEESREFIELSNAIEMGPMPEYTLHLWLFYIDNPGAPFDRIQQQTLTKLKIRLGERERYDSEI